MGFLKIFDKKNQIEEHTHKEVESFREILIKTQDIKKSLEKISQKEAITLEALDFKIVSYNTFYQMGDTDTPKALNELNKDEVLSQENLLNPSFKIFQEYKVEVFQKEGTQSFPLSLAVGSNSDFTTVRVKIRAKESVKYDESFDARMRQEIDKRLAKNGILIGIWDEKLRAGIKRVISAIRVNGGLSKDVVLDVCNAIPPVYPINNKWIMHYKKGENKDEQYDIYAVKRGDIVLEYLKSKEGRNGRNCKGEIIEVKSIELSKESEVEIKVSDDFIIKEDDDRVLYIANKDGYIKQEGDRYEIKEEFVVDSISKKNSGGIHVGDDSNISVVVTEGNSGVDAVGPGVEIDTHEICVAGHVANNAKIKAVEIEIKGQTHKSATIYGKNVKIHLHKGFVEGDEVEVEILEGGVIEGDIVRVGKLSGGEIRAKEVYIKEVLSNATVIASHLIEFDKIEGNGNKFIVDPKAQRGYEEKLKALQDEIAELERKIKSLPRELRGLKKRIESEQESIDEIKKSIQEMKKFDKTPPASMILKLRTHQERIKEFNSLVKELKDAKIHNEQLHEELKEISASAFEAKVINHSPWKEFNEVIFKLVEPPVEVSFLPKEEEFVEVLTLEEGEEEGNFHIKREENTKGDHSS